MTESTAALPTAAGGTGRNDDGGAEYLRAGRLKGAGRRPGPRGE